jgi:hypothetical protein
MLFEISRLILAAQTPDVLYENIKNTPFYKNLNKVCNKTL